MEYDKTSYPLRVLTGVDKRGLFANDKVLTPSERAYITKTKRNFFNDTKQYNKYLDIIGKVNLPSTIDKFQDLKYNNKSEWELLKNYTHSRKSGMLSSFSTFEDYKLYKKRIDNEIVGTTTVDGRTITGQTKHFMERLLGTSSDPHTGKPRSGVTVEAVQDALLSGNIKDESLTKQSIRYTGKEAVVTINSDTGVLIQCNPKRGKN